MVYWILLVSSGVDGILDALLVSSGVDGILDTTCKFRGGWYIGYYL